ncbi:hypothetical protein IAU59_007606 [Kwoniella sp. CBS 9459]
MSEGIRGPKVYAKKRLQADAKTEQAVETGTHILLDPEYSCDRCHENGRRCAVPRRKGGKCISCGRNQCEWRIDGQQGEFQRPILEKILLDRNIDAWELQIGQLEASLAAQTDDPPDKIEAKRTCIDKLRELVFSYRRFIADHKEIIASPREHIIPQPSRKHR